MSRSNILYFLSTTFLFSYLFWTPSVLEYFNIIDLGDLSQPIYLISLLVGAFGPAFGVSMTLRKNDQSVKDHWKRIFNLSGITLPLLFIAVFLPIVINGSSILIGMIVGLDIPPGRLPSLWLYLPNLLFVTLLGGGQEEIGWRGYLQDQTDVFFGSNTISSMFIGFFWGLWHIPLWFMIWDEHDITPFLGFILMTISISIVYGKLYKYSSNLLLAMILHGSSNAIHAVFYLQYLDQSSANQPLYWIYVGVNIAFGLLFHIYDNYVRNSS